MRSRQPAPRWHGWIIAHGAVWAAGYRALCCPLAGTLDLANSTLEGLVATPQAIMEATKDGPALVDTPTLRRLAGLQHNWMPGWGWPQERAEGGGQGGESRGRVVGSHENND